MRYDSIAAFVGCGNRHRDHLSLGTCKFRPTIHDGNFELPPGRQHFNIKALDLTYQAYFPSIRSWPPGFLVNFLKSSGCLLWWNCTNIWHNLCVELFCHRRRRACTPAGVSKQAILMAAGRLDFNSSRLPFFRLSQARKSLP